MVKFKGGYFAPWLFAVTGVTVLGAEPLPLELFAGTLILLGVLGVLVVVFLSFEFPEVLAAVSLFVLLVINSAIASLLDAFFGVVMA